MSGRNHYSTNDSRGHLPIDDFLTAATKIIGAVIGIPLNFVIVILIISLRRLHSKSRNIFILAVIFSNLLAYLPSVTQLVYWCYPVESLRQIYIETVGLPPVVLLFSALLGLIDRYVAMQYPLWRRKKITIRRVRIGCFLLFTSVIAPLFLRVLYIAVDRSPAPSRNPEIAETKVCEWIKIVLFVLCIAIHSIVYRKTRNLLRETNSIIEEDNTVGDEFRATPPTSHVNNGIGKEVETARTWVVVVAVFIVTICPAVFFASALSFCHLMNYVECVHYFNWLALYAEQLVYLIHAACNPVVWLVKNDELRFVSNTRSNRISLKILE